MELALECSICIFTWGYGQADEIGLNLIEVGAQSSITFFMIQMAHIVKAISASLVN